MIRSLRAAGLAAAAVGLYASLGVSAPTFASQAEPVAAIPYTVHATSRLGESELTAESLGLNELQDPPAPATADEFDSPLEPQRTRSLTELVADFRSSDAGNSETDCLARGVYYEAKSESLSGQLSVAEVILNRSRSGRFASTICGVLRQRGQFSFVRGGQIPTPPPGRQWTTAVAIARIARAELAQGSAPRALFFHARHVSPGWRLTRVATVGNHIFYR